MRHVHLINVVRKGPAATRYLRPAATGGDRRRPMRTGQYEIGIIAHVLKSSPKRLGKSSQLIKSKRLHFFPFALIHFDSNQKFVKS